MWNLKQSKPIDTENKVVIARCWGMGLGKINDGGQNVKKKVKIHLIS